MFVSLNEKKISKREKTYVPIRPLSSHLPQMTVLSKTVCSENIRKKIKVHYVIYLLICIKKYKYLE